MSFRHYKIHSILITQFIRLFHCWNSLLHPFRHRFSFQEVIEELLQANLEVKLIRRLGRPMRFTGIIQHPCRLAQTLQCYKILDTLVPGHVTVLVIMHNQNRSFHLVHQEQWRVFIIATWVTPQRSAQTALRMFVLERAGQSRSPADTTICTEHIHHRSTRFDSSKQTGTGC